MFFIALIFMDSQENFLQFFRLVFILMPFIKAKNSVLPEKEKKWLIFYIFPMCFVRGVSVFQEISPK